MEVYSQLYAPASLPPLLPGLNLDGTTEKNNRLLPSLTRLLIEDFVGFFSSSRPEDM